MIQADVDVTVRAKAGDRVKVHVVGKLETGTVFADSRVSAPLQFEIGHSRVFKAIQNAVIGMSIDESKTIKVAPENGYGTYKKGLIKEVEKKFLPHNAGYVKGKIVKLPFTSGKIGKATVLDTNDSSITFDLNHPLAGKHVVFDISLVEIL
jgi:peptidylprolyl isomerase